MGLTCHGWAVGAGAHDGGVSALRSQPRPEFLPEEGPQQRILGQKCSQLAGMGGGVRGGGGGCPPRRPCSRREACL